MQNPPIQNPLKGIALKLGSVVVFITMASLIKAAEVPAGAVIFGWAVMARIVGRVCGLPEGRP